MTTAERKQFFATKLVEQRHLLRSAIETMGAGDLTHALHVATIIRTLVHETGSSKPLLKYLKPNYLELPILDVVHGPPKQNAITYYCPVSAKLSAPPASICLMTEMNLPTYSQSILGAWWNSNPCMVLPGLGPFYRKELILGLANKEGGAHVDADIPQRYQSVLESQFVHAKINDIDLGALNISRLTAGRAGVELLHFLKSTFPTS